ncbi:MAG: hypothetical protein LIR46_00815, partial [Bacteroidota bacterium]|nr:hypothetical protein [Bacteroidota bacterium]
MAVPKILTIRTIEGETDIEFPEIDATLTEENMAADAKATGDELAKKANSDGLYEDMTVGNAEQLISTKYEEDHDPYLFRTSGGTLDIGNRESKTLIGGTVAWNQLVDHGNFDVTTGWTLSNSKNASVSNNVLSFEGTTDASMALPIYRTANVIDGHIVFASAKVKCSSDNEVRVRYPFTSSKNSCVANTWTVIEKIDAVASGETKVGIQLNAITDASYSVKDFMLIDLTQMFGSTIADYIYGLEQEIAGAGVAWFRKYFPKPYYPYNAGQLISVNPTSHNTVGFNVWDEEWEVGSIDGDGNNSVSSDRIRTKNYIDVLGGASYYFSINDVHVIHLWDSDYNYIGNYYKSVANIFTMPDNARYMKFRLNTTYGITYNNDICINLSWSGYRDGEYEPYKKNEYPIDPVELRGLPVLTDDGELYYDGDIREAVGRLTRKRGVYTFTGNESLTQLPTNTTGWYQYAYIPSPEMVYNQLNDIQCDKFNTILYNDYTSISSSLTTPLVMHYGTGVRFVLNVSTTAAAQAAIAGTTIEYPLATPTTEQVTPFVANQAVDDFGTEEFVDTRDVPMPVGHITKYQANLRDKVQHLPSLADEDGTFFVKQEDSQMYLVDAMPTINRKANVDGHYEDMVVGGAEQLLSSDFTEDNIPYNFRAAGGDLSVGDREYLRSIVGGSLVMNQLITAEGESFTNSIEDQNGTSLNLKFRQIVSPYTQLLSKSFGTGIVNTILAADSDITGMTLIHSGVTRNITIYGNANLSVINGHKYLLSIDIVSATVNVVGGIVTKDFQLIDLTQMFGPTIADYVYTLETGTAGAGVAWLKAHFPKIFDNGYQAYNAGQIVSVEGLASHDTVGFNVWDEEWELGDFDSSGNKHTNANRIRSKNYVRVLPKCSYYIQYPYSDYGLLMW